MSLDRESMFCFNLYRTKSLKKMSRIWRKGLCLPMMSLPTGNYRFRRYSQLCRITHMNSPFFFNTKAFSKMWKFKLYNSRLWCAQTSSMTLQSHSLITCLVSWANFLFSIHFVYSSPPITSLAACPFLLLFTSSMYDSSSVCMLSKKNWNYSD